MHKQLYLTAINKSGVEDRCFVITNWMAIDNTIVVNNNREIIVLTKK